MENLNFTKEIKHKMAQEIRAYLAGKTKQCIANYDKLLVDINTLVEVAHLFILFLS